MLCFQLVKTVLDELYERIPLERNDQKDELIKEKIAHLEQAYRKLHLGLPIDHSDIATQFAYIQRYVTCHANLVYEIIKTAPKLKSLFDQPKAKITCIGGGPGSELIGILKFLLEANKKPKLSFNLYDREKGWGDCWEDIHEKLNLPMDINSRCSPMDVLNQKDWRSNTKYLNSDLFSMVYFLSEIEKKKQEATPFFDNLFAKAQVGSLFLFIDNRNAKYYGWFDQLISRHSIQVLTSYQGSMKIWDRAEEKQDLAVYYKKFGPPKLTAEAAYRVCRKK
jgi:hypothetical protein